VLRDAYFNSIYREAVRQAGLRRGEKVLDFGCGDQRLKSFLPDGIRYTGYDSEPDFSDVVGYWGERPDVVFALSVLEHLRDGDVGDFVSFCCLARPRRVVVALPCGNFVNSVMRFVTARNFVTGIYHVNDWRGVCRRLASRLELLGYKRVWLMSWVSSWMVKSERRN